MPAEDEVAWTDSGIAPFSHGLGCRRCERVLRLQAACRPCDFRSIVAVAAGFLLPGKYWAARCDPIDIAHIFQFSRGLMHDSNVNSA